MGQEAGKRKRAVWWWVAGILGLPLAFYACEKLSYEQTGDRGYMGLSHLRQTSVAMEMYQADNDGRFPAQMSTSEDLRGALGGYARSVEIFDTLNPDGSVFLGNGLLAGRRVAWLYGQETTISVYDSKIWRERGLRNVGFVDGHVKFVDEDDFNYGLKVEQLIADPPG